MGSLYLAAAGTVQVHRHAIALQARSNEWIIEGRLDTIVSAASQEARLRAKRYGEQAAHSHRLT